ncbi:MAG: bifunctional methylenetetrahydrofolate dehydrogenase/methenyltetrahydrofolate cyclohydrolase FolD, partial [Myxococcota bacterium]
MTGIRIDGKAVAKALRARVKDQAEEFLGRSGRPPGLDVVLVGEDPASQVYTRNKQRAAEKAGIRGRLHRLSASTSQIDLESLVSELNADDTTDGILVQLPLPPGLADQPVLDRIDPNKDVDGLHPVNAGLLSAGRPGLVPCTPQGCMHLLREVDAKIEGAHAVMVGRSNLMGKPMAQLLLAAQATVTIAHSRTADLAELCRTADILVVAVGRAEMVKAAWVKPGAVVLDVGINRTEEGALVGDVDYEAVLERARAITPVPGGVGPMTIACLLENTVRAAARRA